MRIHLLHDEVELVSTAVDIVCIYKDILDLLLFTTCGSSHDASTIICLRNELVLVVIRENGAQPLQKCCGNGISGGTLERYELKKTLLDMMGFVNVADHKHQLTLSLDGDKVCTPDFFNDAVL